MVLRDSFTEFGGDSDCAQCKRFFEPQNWLQITCTICKEDLKSHGDIYVHHTIHGEYQQNNDVAELKLPKQEPRTSDDFDAEEELPTFKCRICFLLFNDLQALEMHIAMHHDGETSEKSTDLPNSLDDDHGNHAIKAESCEGLQNENDFDAGFPSPNSEDFSNEHHMLEQSLLEHLVPETILKSVPDQDVDNAEVEEKFLAFIKCYECDVLCATVDKLMEHKVRDHLKVSSKGEIRTAKLEIVEANESEAEEDESNAIQINEFLHTMSLRWRENIKKTRDNPSDAKCKICGKQFRSKKYLLGVHMPTTHDKDVAPTVQCDECGKTFNRQRYHQHKQLRHRKEPFKCTICNEFESWEISKMSQHKKQVHGMKYNNYTKKYEVTYDQKANSLNITQLDKDCFSCNYCGLKLMNKFKMQTHVVAVHETEYEDSPLSRYRELPGDTLECLICGQTSENNKYIMQNHIFSEHSENFIVKKPPPKMRKGQESKWAPSPDKISKEGDFYYCGYCDSKSKNKYHMWRHIFKSHEWKLKPDDEKISVCHYCGYKNGDSQYMAEHIKYVHEGVKRPKKPARPKKHLCHLCTYKARWNSELQHHIENVHLGIKVRKVPNTSNHPS